jgi:hypothetical protein
MCEKPSRSFRPGANSGKISTVPGALLSLAGWMGISASLVKGLWMMPMGLKMIGSAMRGLNQKNRV